MDYMTLNALGIFLLAGFGLWAFYHAAKNGKKRPPRKKDDDEKPES